MALAPEPYAAIDKPQPLAYSVIRLHEAALFFMIHIRPMVVFS
jgi:hypothetical protein